MEFFTEKNGKYIAQPIVGNRAKGPVVRIILTLIPLGILAALFYLSPIGKEGSPDRTPLLIGGGMVVFSNLVAVFLKRAGLGSGVSVDQMNNTISFRRPGGNRRTVQIDTLREIILNTIPGKATILCLGNSDGSRHVLMFAKDTMKIRQLADELSTLTSLTVTEEVKHA